MEIRTCGTDFPVNTTIRLKKPLPSVEWSAPLSTDHFTVSNCTGSYGQFFEFKELVENNFLASAFRRPFEFLVELEALSPSATGNFKTEIRILEDYEYYDGFGLVSCQPPNSCCRMAVEGSASGEYPIQKMEMVNPSMKLIPNPASQKVKISLSGMDKKSRLRITDIFGRTVWQTINVSDAEINLSQLPKGIYQVCVQDHEHSLVKTLVVE